MEPGVSPLYIRELGKYTAFAYMTLATLFELRFLREDEEELMVNNSDRVSVARREEKGRDRCLGV